MIEYTTHSHPLSDETLATISTLVAACFSEDPPQDFNERARQKPKPVAMIAWEGSTPVGFKLGYERSREEFYSWLGGIIPAFRRQRIAEKLLTRQHQWCREAGYRCVTTEALNDNPAMLTLNLKHGFVIVGTRTNDRGLRVLMTKALAAGA